MTSLPRCFVVAATSAGKTEACISSFPVWMEMPVMAMGSLLRLITMQSRMKKC